MAIILRQYQEAAVDELRNGFRLGHKRQILSASTGAGKSVIMLDMVRNAIEKKSRTIFICERRNLIEQFSAHLDQQGIPHGIIMAGHWRWDPSALVQVASAQTLERMETWRSLRRRSCFVQSGHRLGDSQRASGGDCVQQEGGRTNRKGTDRNALSELLERRFASLDAMLLAVCGESGDAFRETNSDQVQDDYMWACHSIVAEARALFQQITSAGVA